MHSDTEAGLRPDEGPRATAYTAPVDVLLLYTRDEEVLLALRRNTGYADGQWNLASGKLGAGETVQAAMAREALEELDIRLLAADLQQVHVIHWLSPQRQGRIGLAFHVRADPARHGEPRNAEPHKCAELLWSRADALPSPAVEYSSAAVAALLQRRRVHVAGPWPGAS